MFLISLYLFNIDFPMHYNSLSNDIMIIVNFV